MLGSTILCNDNNKVEQFLFQSENYGVVEKEDLLKSDCDKLNSTLTIFLVVWLQVYYYFISLDLISLFYIKNFKKVIHKFQFKKKNSYYETAILVSCICFPMFFLILGEKFSLAGKKSVMHTYSKFAKAHIFLNYNA